MNNNEDKLQKKTAALIKLYNQGRLFDLINESKKLINEYPQAFIIWNLLGAASKRLGKIDQAFTSIKKVTELNPDYADGHNNLGVILQDLGRFDESIDSFNKALSLRPNYSEAYNNLAITYRKNKKYEESVNLFNKAISLNPNYAEAYNNLATTLKEQGKVNEAIELFKKAFSLKPNYAEAYYNMGIVLQEQDDFQKATELYMKAISLNPNYAEAYNNLATTLKEQGKVNEAIELFKKAFSLKPNYAEAYYNMGKVQKEKNKFEDSIKFYNIAISLKPNYVEAYYNIANIFQEQGKLAESIDYFNKILLIKPNYEKAQAQKLYQKAKICNWKKFREDREIVNKLGKLNNDIPPFTMLSLEDNPDNHLLRSQIYVKKNLYQKQIPFKKDLHFFKKKHLHIGYFSADFQNHATMYLISEIFEKYNREEFKVYVYSFGKSTDSDEIRQKLKNTVDVFRDVIDLDEKSIALLSRKDNIDIAIDLKGYTRNSRPKIFAYRAAPIQINFLGYPGTIGADFMDYIIADTVIIPNNKRKNYSEKKIYLPYTYWPTSYSISALKKNYSRSEMNLPDRGFVFCCFNNSYKISSIEFKIWMRLLKRVEGSVLWLMESNKWAENNLYKEAEKYGIKSNRLIFANKLTYSDHLARCKLGDLFLDTFNYNAHTTASDALWAGMPLVTKIGEGFTARVASSILMALDLPELITKNEKDYESLIFEIATSSEKLFKIKKKLSENKLIKPLFNSELFIKYLEDGYKKVYQNYLDGNKTKTIFINK
ncbi:tetratricopeptide repeat protein [Alphaproteobacteria bacterium]|nr:tetratricopeptide repeat protein [Alphaproteobacteria bacterium]